MAIPETDVSRIRRWVEAQIKTWAGHADEVRIEMDIDSRAVTILECRPPWDDPSNPEWIRQEVARLRYTMSRKEWTFCWPDRNSKFRRYDRTDPTPTAEALLTEIAVDQTRIFWG